VLEQVNAYKTSDGKLFENEEDAKNHLFKLSFEEPIYNIVNYIFQSYENISKEDIVNFIINQREILLNVLQRKLCDENNR